MTSSSYASAYHEQLRNDLKELCDNCTMKDTKSIQCGKSKTDCIFYNCRIAEYVLSNYHEAVVKKEISIGAVVRGIHSHGYTGELRQTRIVKI